MIVLCRATKKVKGINLYGLLVLKLKRKNTNFWEIFVVQNVCTNVHLRISLCAWYVSGIRKVAVVMIPFGFVSKFEQKIFVPKSQHGVCVQFTENFATVI